MKSFPQNSLKIIKDVESISVSPNSAYKINYVVPDGINLIFIGVYVGGYINEEHVIPLYRGHGVNSSIILGGDLYRALKIGFASSTGAITIGTWGTTEFSINYKLYVLN